MAGYGFVTRVRKEAVAVRANKIRLGLFAVVLVLASANSVAPYGYGAARWIAIVLQGAVGTAAMICAVIVARRMHGVARAWRLLVIAAMTSWLVGEAIWWISGAGAGRDTAPPAAVAAYFLPPVLSLTAMILLARAGGLRGIQDGPVDQSRIVAALDGLVAAAAFSVLVVISGRGAMTGAAAPRSQNAVAVLAYSILELVVVVLAVLMAMAFQRGRPYRANYLWLACGVVLIAGSDRLVGYLGSVGAERGELWGGIGSILGPLAILFAVLDLDPQPTVHRRQSAVDWVRTVLPYLGFVMVVMLMAFHMLIGRRLDPVVVVLGVLMVLLVTARQVAAAYAQSVLTRRLVETQLRLAHQVHHDSLTGLPNRLLFAERLDAALADGGFVLIFVDLDDFKEVNDRFGHAAGDELLRAVGDRLSRCVGTTDTLARIGGDEFAILIDGEHEAPEVVADRLRVALRDPFAVHGSSVRVRASMGLVRPGPDEARPTSDDLLRQADISMYAGKRLGKDTAVVYQPLSGVSVDFPTALRRASGHPPDGFSLAYQPVVELPHGAPVAVEALARWAAPNGMQIPPETFVAAAEGAGLGAVLDALVLDMACLQVQAAGLDLDIHVNIGAARLGNRSFEQQVSRTLARHRVVPRRLVLEVTETVPIVDIADGAAAIRRLTALGVRVALDDFGAGFNSLTYLHALPVQILKLDRSLAAGAEHDGNVALYRSVIGLSDDLGLEVIAEGIESPGQADIVYEAGCRMAQGHLFGRAVVIDELAGDLRTRACAAGRSRERACLPADTP